MNLNKENIDNEKWLPVIGYEGWYEVSDLGRVKRARAGASTYAGKILNPWLNGGYICVNLLKNGKRKTIKVHRLVAHSFIGPCRKGKEVNHIDGNKKNSSLCNLEYVTHSENILHAFAIGKSSKVGERNSSNKLTEDDVYEVRERLDSGETQVSIAKSFGVKQATISSISRGETWTHLK